MTTILRILIWGLAFYCIINGWNGVLMYLLIGVITEIVFSKILWTNYINTLNKLDPKLLENMGSVKRGYIVSIVLGVLLWPLNIVSIINLEEPEITKK